jgi:hypothetical protein
LLLVLGVALAVWALPAIAADAAPKLLEAGELLALVAGNALPEKVVALIKADGLNFRSDDAYRAQLKTGGADGSVLAAVDGAKVEAGAAPVASGEIAHRAHVSWRPS